MVIIVQYVFETKETQSLHSRIQILDSRPHVLDSRPQILDSKIQIIDSRYNKSKCKKGIYEKMYAKLKCFQ